MNRRQFLAASAGLVAGASLAAQADDAIPFRLGIQSYTFRQFKLEQALQRMQKLGLKNAEFYKDHIPPTSTPSQVEAVLKLCKEYDVKPMAFGVHGFSKDHDTLIGSCLDTGHLIRSEQLGYKLDPAEEVRKMGARNFGIHLKDHDNA